MDQVVSGGSIPDLRERGDEIGGQTYSRVSSRAR